MSSQDSIVGHEIVPIGLEADQAAAAGGAIEELLVRLASPAAPESIEIASVHVDSPGNPTRDSIRVPLKALKLLRSILAELGRGNSVAITPIPPNLTIKQAASLIHVSAPFLQAQIDRGELRMHQVGSLRLIRYVDLMDYMRRIGEARMRSLDELTAQAQELRMGY